MRYILELTEDDVIQLQTFDVGLATKINEVLKEYPADALLLLSTDEDMVRVKKFVFQVPLTEMYKINPILGREPSDNTPSRQDLDALMAEYTAKGGAVTKGPALRAKGYGGA